MKILKTLGLCGLILAASPKSPAAQSRNTDEQKIKQYRSFESQYKQMESKLSLLALWIDLYKNENGKYPLNWDELTPFLKKRGDGFKPGALNDIGSSEEIVYLSNGKDFLMYSRGIDKKDDHGKILDKIKIDGLDRVIRGDLSKTNDLSYDPFIKTKTGVKAKAVKSPAKRLSEINTAIMTYYGVHEGVWPKSLKEISEYYPDKINEDEFKYDPLTGKVNIK